MRPVLIAALLWAGAAHAQTDPMAMLRTAAANQLGVMEFCQAQGYADGDAVSAQRDAFARLPPAPAGAPPTEPAQALGRTGTLSANGTQTTLASLASSRSTSVGALCGQMASAAKQAAAAQRGAGMPQMGGMPSMGAMPSFPTGTVPGMPAMPTMPGMPAMPGAPAVSR